MPHPIPITVAHGDGIGPEIMEAVLFVLREAGAPLEVETIEIGEKIYRQGFSTGIEPQSWESIRRTGVLLKAPITTPQGGGVKSLNVTLRKTLGLFANLRPCRSYHPFVQTHYPNTDLVIVRENEEDLYAGIEHRQTQEVTQCLKLISRPGSERIIRYAFEYTRQCRRKRVTCLSKDNIMKLTDGLFHQVFREVSKEYPDIEADHLIVDIGMARVADMPESFDVIVTPNLYGDILSDIAAEISGSVGMAGSANIGERFAMFEAIHGSAPDIAGKNAANPSGLLLGAIKMLAHVGQGDLAEKIHNALLATIEDGIHTGDIFDPKRSRERAGTEAFSRAVVERLGRIPEKLVAAHYAAAHGRFAVYKPGPPAEKKLVGVDVFVDFRERDPEKLAAILKQAARPELPLGMITNRGVKVWPEGYPETFCSDHWRCRFERRNGGAVTHQMILALLERLVSAGLDCIKTENLYLFDGDPGYSRGQGE